MPSSYATSTHSSSVQTAQSISQQIGSRVRNMAQLGQPTVDIELDEANHGPNAKYVTSYSTMDEIKGTVHVTAQTDTRFEDLEIAFIGETHVYVDRITSTPSLSGRTEATHRFLTLKQPLGRDDFPTPRIFLARKTYSFPFTFTIPTQLLPRACSHSVSSDHVRNTHLMLPPSLGDPSLAGFGGTLLDDLAPEMSKIVYGIKVRLASLRETDGTVYFLAEKFKKVRVKPAFEEQPPLTVDPSDQEYRIRQAKTIKKGLFKGKLGTLTAQSAQPKALVIPGARTTGAPAITTMAKVLLRFDPADESNPPPRLGSLATKMKVSTFFSSMPRPSFPTRSALSYDLTQGVYSETINLSTLCIASAPWEKRSSSENPASESLVRRDSGISDCSTGPTADDTFNAGILPASKHYKGGPFYTAEILVPITLPMTKNFLPTFHSCLVSRMYTLTLQLSAHAPGVADPSLGLKVPIQICAEGSDTGNENARARNAEMRMVSEADDLLRPRSFAPPPPPMGVDDLPPRYAAFGQVGVANVR
ncbi:arrestin [Lojkania enalia]|uniref:Arrestin n=1 Tax=Lojkania enalia TaxID=147567 RepID=A0A9P4MU87_9PLEO|nr:arrestin [Didymosphaeria enalia]